MTVLLGHFRSLKYFCNHLIYKPLKIKGIVRSAFNSKTYYNIKVSIIDGLTVRCNGGTDKDSAVFVPTGAMLNHSWTWTYYFRRGWT